MPTTLTAIKLEIPTLSEQKCRIRPDLDLELSLQIRIRPAEKVSDITVIQVIMLCADLRMLVGSLKKFPL
jgi:hypothetical protein